VLSPDSLPPLNPLISYLSIIPTTSSSLPSPVSPHFLPPIVRRRKLVVSKRGRTLVKEDPEEEEEARPPGTGPRSYARASRRLLRNEIRTQGRRIHG
jgi:hypothetical protein